MVDVSWTNLPYTTFFIIRPLYRLKSVIIDENEDTITIHNIITKSTLKISSLKAISYKETSKGLLSKAALISVCDKESRSLDILTVTENAILIASQLSDLNPSIQVYHK